MRKITHSGSQYLRYSAFNPDKTEKAARHRATAAFTPCPPERRRFCELPERPRPTRSKRHSLQLACIDHGFSFPLLFRVLHP
jgi:hypothetical protein